jgi:hypothetical protein
MKMRMLAGLLLFVALVSCGKTGPQEPPVATPSLSVNHARVPLGSPVEMKFKFVVAPGAKIDHDYSVFVHFLDNAREMMWADDHLPSVPTSQWKPGQTIEYTRMMFAPVYPYVGEATIEVGLYLPTVGTRLVLSGNDRGHQSYEVTKFELLPQTENIFLIYKDGWYPTEVPADNPAAEWQWTKKEATLAFRNPKRDVTFFLNVGGQPLLLGETQTVSVRIGDQVIDTFQVKEDVLKRIPFTAAQLGTGEMIEVKIAVDKPFVPALVPALKNRDDRELGVRILHAFIEPK